MPVEGALQSRHEVMLLFLAHRKLPAKQHSVAVKTSLQRVVPEKTLVGKHRFTELNGSATYSLCLHRWGWDVRIALTP